MAHSLQASSWVRAARTSHVEAASSRSLRECTSTPGPAVTGPGSDLRATSPSAPGGWIRSCTATPHQSARPGAAHHCPLAAALPALHQAAPPARIPLSYVDRLRERTVRLRRLDDILGGGDTYRVYLAEVQRTKAVPQRGSFAGDDVRRHLTVLLAEQAQQAGWAAFDGGRGKEAASLYEEGRTYAREAGDSDLHGNSLAFLACGTLAHDRRTAVGFAQDSCATITDRTPATVRALLYERLAWACAVNGEAAGTEAALDSARESLETAQDGEPQPDWSVWVDRTELGIMTGRCWTELARPLRAVPALTDALGRYPDEYARDKALYLSWLAEAFLRAGEVEQAAVTADRALHLATGVASIRPMQRIAPVLESLRPHGQLPEVRGVLERVAS
ncbi:hypothetical protein GCM10014713_68700 [Streptomyces purpureus]|uniref:XRE family transcriptional regulator n=1 Tax=Streptomyces purpureus TaxID=1951 RepID=A0A918LY14_9ACTN|nr:hypothetical protein GCM10014713_68700 [Streptomyces purpureus]